MTPGLCLWCQHPFDHAGKYCSRRCRQSAWRCRQTAAIERLSCRSATVAYADPPYPGLASYYADQPTFAGEVDHAALVSSMTDRYDGWALSTSSQALRDVLPLCPRAARVCAWVKPIGVSGATRGLHSTWEPLIVMPARRLRPGKRDWLSAQPARGNGELIGRKPVAFCNWLFSVLGMIPGDTLIDLFPGTGIVSRSWELLCRYAVAEDVADGSRGPSLFPPDQFDNAALVEHVDVASRSADEASATPA